MQKINTVFKNFKSQNNIIESNNIKYKEITLSDLLTLFIDYNIPIAKETLEELKQHQIYYVKQ